MALQDQVQKISSESMRCDRLAECEFLLKMAMAVDYGGVFLWETDVAKGFIKVSESMLRHLGYTTKQTERSLRDWEELFVAEDWVIARETIDDCISNNKNEFTIQYRMIASDGKRCWFQSRGTFVRNNEGRATRILGAGIDITAICKIWLEGTADRCSVVCKYWLESAELAFRHRKTLLLQRRFTQLRLDDRPEPCVP